MPTVPMKDRLEELEDALQDIRDRIDELLGDDDDDDVE